MFEQTIRNIDDVPWKEVGSSSELDYTEQTYCLLFLKYLDDLEAERASTTSKSAKPTSHRAATPKAARLE
jgi:type I restriction enzyme M protein